MSSTPGRCMLLAGRVGTTGLVTGLLLLTGGDALAGSSIASTPVSAAECTVAPRPTEDVVAMLKAPPGLLRSSMDGTPLATPVLAEGGIPADAETVERVTATARELIACLNAGDFARLVALHSDHYFMGLWGGAGGPNLSDDEIAAQLQEFSFVAPQPAESRIALIGVEDVRILPDGRVLATVINDRGGSRATFIKVGDRYLVDWAYPMPDEGTPTPS